MPTPPDPWLQQFRGLLVRIRQRPQNDCRTIGELEEIISQLYDICAATAGRDEAFARGIAAELQARGLGHVDELVPDTERSHWFGTDDPLARRVIAFWTALDEPLGFPSPPDAPSPDGHPARRPPQ